MQICMYSFYHSLPALDTLCVNQVFLFFSVGHVTPSLHFSSQLCQLWPFLIFVSPSGDADPHPRHGGDPWLVPADPWEAAGAQHHGLGLQQHRRHAGRVFPRLQDRILRSSFPLSLLLASPGVDLFLIALLYSLICKSVSALGTWPKAETDLDNCLFFSRFLFIYKLVLAITICITKVVFWPLCPPLHYYYSVLLKVNLSC